MSRRRPLVSFAFVPFLAAAVGAQERKPEPAGSFVVGGGVDLVTTERAASTPGAALLGGYERRLGGSRVSLRAEGEYWSRGVRYDGAIDGVPVRSIARVRTISGASLLGLYRFAPAARFRPYALAGVGYQQLSLRNETDWVSPDGDPNVGSKIVYRPPVRVNSVAYTAGLGVDVPLGRASLFLEARTTLLPAGTPALGGRTAVQGMTAPLTLGLRF